jgi:hypothetical protein
MSAAECRVKTLFGKLYAVHSASPKDEAKLESDAVQLSTKPKSVGRVLGKHWVASTARPVRAICNNYPALYKHLH